MKQYETVLTLITSYCHNHHMNSLFYIAVSLITISVTGCLCYRISQDGPEPRDECSDDKDTYYNTVAQYEDDSDDEVGDDSDSD